MPNTRIVVLIPCYNEAQTVGAVVREYQQALPEAEIIVYDNNSTDCTDDIAREAGATVRYERRQGKGNVLRSMFRNEEADCYIIVDGDDTYPASCARQMVNLVLENGADMVIGDRLSSSYFTENKRPFHNSGNRFMRFLINLLFHSRIHDIMTGNRAFSRAFVKSFPVLSHGFEIETEMTIHALDKNLSVVELPVPYRDRPEGSQSKLHTLRDGTRVLKTVSRLFREYKPYAFFSICAAVLLLAAVVLFVPVLLEYFETGLVARFPTLIGAGFIGVTGILLWICGIVLEVIAQKHRQLFELLLTQLPPRPGAERD